MHAQILIESEALRHIADRRLYAGGIASGVEAEHAERAGIEEEQSGHQPDQRGLARTIRPDEAGDFAALDCGGDLVECRRTGAEYLADSIDPDKVFTHGGSRSI